MEATVDLADAGRVERVSTGEKVALDGGRLLLQLKPYELRAFVCRAGGGPAGLETAIPHEARDRLRAQLAFVEKLLSLDDVEKTVVPFAR